MSIINKTTNTRVSVIGIFLATAQRTVMQCVRQQIIHGVDVSVNMLIY